MTHSELKKAITNMLMQAGALVLQINSGAARVDDRYVTFVTWFADNETGTRGVFDIVALVPAPGGPLMLAVDAKTTGYARANKAQVEFGKRWVARGGTAIITQDIKDVQDFLRRHNVI